MDFLKIIRGFEDLLFEVMTWLIYLPRTLWMVIRHPLRMVDYSNHEQADRETEQYTDTLSPPLLLLLTLALVHGIEISMAAAPIKAGSDVARAIVSSDQNLILLRSFLYGFLPLFAALAYVRKRGLTLERKHLRPPFFGECYLAAVYALMVSLASIIGHFHHPRAVIVGVGCAIAATMWYLAVKTLHLRQALDLPVLHAAATAVWVWVQSLFGMVVLAVVIAGGIH